MNVVTIHPDKRITFGKVSKDYKPPLPQKRDWKQVMRDASVGIIGASNFADLIGKPLNMVLTNVSNLRKLPGTAVIKVRGKKGITALGRQRVRSGATVLQDYFPKERLAFWTVTVPPECLNETLISNWSQVVKSVREKLTYHLKKRGLPTFIVGVTEIQPKRYENSPEIPPLHLHVSFVTAKKNYRPLVGKVVLQKLWGETLRRLSGVQPKSQLSSSVQFVRKSLAGYLGKYMSKGSKGLEGIDDSLIPSSWWFMSGCLRQAIAVHTVKASGEWVNELFQFIRYKKDWFNWSREVLTITESGTVIMRGWVGDISGEEVYNLICKMIADLR